MEKNEILIGREVEKGEYLIDKQYALIGRKHARIIRKSDGIYVEDLDYEITKTFDELVDMCKIYYEDCEDGHYDSVVANHYGVEAYEFYPVYSDTYYYMSPDKKILVTCVPDDKNDYDAIFVNGELVETFRFMNSYKANYNCCPPLDRKEQNEEIYIRFERLLARLMK